MWGIWGLLLAVPMMMVVEAICDRVEDLQPIGKFLGDRPRERVGYRSRCYDIIRAIRTPVLEHPA